MLFRKILVTGCGGDIGLSIGRILLEEDLSESIVGCDVTEYHAGRAFFDSCFVVERASSPYYMESLLKLVASEGIDLVIPTSEPELRTLAEHDFWGKSSMFLTASARAMSVGFDKYQTADFLRQNELPHPWTQVAMGARPLHLPCILKSRTGCGSKAVHILTEENYQEFLPFAEDDMFQELLTEVDAEYTCGVFRGRDDEIRTIVFRRKLRGGLTGSGVVEENPRIERLLCNIAVALELQGSINVQLRLREGEPCVFEINPRFSSTVRFRHKLGFADVLWSLQDSLQIPLSPYRRPKAGLRFYKIYDDVIDWKSV